MSEGTNASVVWKGTAASLALLIVFLAAWQWGPGLLRIPPFIIPPLSMVTEEAVRMWHVSGLAFHTGITAAEVLAGFILGSLLGAFIGYLIGMSPTAEFALSPYILALQIAPKVAFAPLFILWMGFTVYPKILVAIPDRVLPGDGQRADRDPHRRSRPDQSCPRVQGEPRADLLEDRIPASLPPLFAGLRIGSTLAVVGVVVGELSAATWGWGICCRSAKARPTPRWCSWRS